MIRDSGLLSWAILYMCKTMGQVPETGLDSDDESIMQTFSMSKNCEITSYLGRQEIQ